MKKTKVILSRVISSSMEPLIRRGDIVRISPCDHSKIRIGEIAWFKMEQGINFNIQGENKKVSYVVHRIVGRKVVNGKEYFIQKGDASTVSAPIKYEQAAGKIIGIEKKDYLVDLSKLKWKIINSAFAINAILEYRISIIFGLILRIFPKKFKFYFRNKLIKIYSRFKNLIFRNCLFLVRRILV